VTETHDDPRVGTPAIDRGWGESLSTALTVLKRFRSNPFGLEDGFAIEENLS